MLLCIFLDVCVDLGGVCKQKGLNIKDELKDSLGYQLVFFQLTCGLLF